MISEYILRNPPFKFCHAPTIASTAHGLLVSWFAGNREGHKNTTIWISSYKDGTWSEAKEIISGRQVSGRSFACWNPVLHTKGNGEILLFYKTGVSPSKWQGALMVSNDDGESWSNPKHLPPGIYGPTKNKLLELDNDILLCPSSDEQFDNWSIQFESFQHQKWRVSTVPNPQSLSCIQPTLLRHKNNVIQALCRTENRAIAETWSYDNGNTWSNLTATQLPNPNSAIDAVSLSVDKHLLVYNNTDTGRSSLTVAMSRDGKRWYNIYCLENGIGEFSYPSIINEGNTIHMVYSCNRENIKYVSIDLNSFDYRNLFVYPTIDAASSVLRKLQIAPNTRFDEHDQDFEYTSCRVEEIDLYFDLYLKPDTTLEEKHLLGCYMIETLNDYVSIKNKQHPLQDQIFNLLHRDIYLHVNELEYRLDSEDSNEEHWWPIKKYLLAWRKENFDLNF